LSGVLTRPAQPLPAWLRYALAVALVLGATVLRRALVPWLGILTPSNLTLVGVVVATVWLGLGPGLAALLAGAFAVELIIVRPSGLAADLASAGRIVTGLLVGSLVCYLLHALRKAQLKAADHAAEAAARGAVEDRERQLRALIEGVSSAIALIDSGGRFTLYNRRFLAMFGLAPDADIKNVNDTDWSAWQVFDSDGRLLEVDEHPVRKAALTRRPVINQLVGVRLPAGGDLTWMLITATPIVAAGGSVDRIICTYHDVTMLHRAEEAVRKSEEELKRSEEALRQSEDLLSFALDTARTGAWDLDLSDRRARRSPLHDLIFGYDRPLPEWTYEMFLDHVLPEDRKAVDRAFRDAVETGRDWSFECRIQRRDGEVRWIWAAGRHRRGQAGHAGRMAGIVQDITERRQAEEALRAANLRLAEEDRRKNEFLAMLSHELRNPLMPIRNGLYVLERSAAGSEQAGRAMVVIRRQTAQLARLVDDLLDLTRISRNKIQLQHRRLDLNELVRRTVDDHRSLFEEKGIRLETTFGAERLPVNGDEARLTQVIGNLMHNAAKFTQPRGEVQVAIEASGTRARLRVADNGAGIEPAILRRLFQPFMQAETTLDRTRGGLGLGLALVKGLVEMHGGEVSASSEGPGTGAAFVVELPLDTRPETRSEAPTLPSVPRKRKVLVIEDNTDAAESLRAVLELQGHDVEVAGDGPSGLALARAGRPEVVLCDIGLPGMDGFEVARALRAEPSATSAYLVALTGYALPEDLQRAASAGFDRHLAKPASPEAIERVLADLRDES
jgi:two-component system CheB/CheR fusion protein